MKNQYNLHIDVEKFKNYPPQTGYNVVKYSCKYFTRRDRPCLTNTNEFLLL